LTPLEPDLGDWDAELGSSWSALSEVSSLSWSLPAAELDAPPPGALMERPRGPWPVIEPVADEPLVAVPAAAIEYHRGYVQGVDDHRHVPSFTSREKVLLAIVITCIAGALVGVGALMVVAR
jgi:hypothetical protein